ncbi:hypothetical protein ACT3TY_16300 [Halomonas sp. AOP22-C1-8]|uniref:hypothetical protein n=1 Tax=Halomonas sp. AOP22-C1-8 TaxID=3457717 RepID=UPI004034D41A
MTDVATAVRQLLTTAPEKTLPITYQQVAAALGLTPPRTIQRVAQALEQLMRDDAAAHQPFIAALVVSRRGDNMPAAGFFELAVALGRFSDDTTQHAKAYRHEYQQVLASRSNA